MVSPSPTPLLMFILWLGCHQAVGVDVFQEFNTIVFYPLFLKRRQDYFTFTESIVYLLFEFD